MSAPFWRWQGRGSQEILTLPWCCGKVDGSTHTLRSIAGGDLIEPNVLSVKCEEYNGLGHTVLHVPPKEISFPFSNNLIPLRVALTCGKYLWLQSSSESVILNSTELLQLVESSVFWIGLPTLGKSWTSGDWKHSGGSLDSHDHDTLMPRRRPLSLWISSAWTPSVVIPIIMQRLIIS